MTTRRKLLSASLALASTYALSGCGFHLRGTFNVPFNTLYLQMTPNTPFSTWLERRLKAETHLKIVDQRDDAEAILQLVSENRNRDVLTFNDAGRVREYRLTMSISFRLTAPDGYEYLPTTRLSTIRDISYSERNYLSQETEEATLYRDMTFDLVEQLISVLGAVKPRKATL